MADEKEIVDIFEQLLGRKLGTIVASGISEDEDEGYFNDTDDSSDEDDVECGHDYDMSCPPCSVCGGCPECGDCDCGMDNGDDEDWEDDEL